MIVIAPGKHPEADKFWKEKLGSKPNGARTLGTAIEKNLTDIFEQYYDMLVCYASDFNFEIPDGVKKIAIIWHQNFPWTEGFKAWQRVNLKLANYDVNYFVNESVLGSLISHAYKQSRVYYLPRFIDTFEYPVFKVKKDINTLWFGNAWGEFKSEFEMYKNLVDKPMWITHGELGRGEETIKKLTREETLKTVARAETVWAIGVSQLEAKYYGCNITSYRGEPLPFYDQNTIRDYLRSLLEDKVRPLSLPGLGE